MYEDQRMKVEGIKLLPLFSSDIGMSFIEEDTREELSSQRAFHYPNQYQQKNRQDLRHDFDFRALEKFPRTKELIMTKFKEFGKDIGYDLDWKMTTSWFTLMEPGMEGQMHYHRNSFYSGVYYYDDYDQESAKLHLRNPLHDYFDYFVMPTEDTAANSTQTAIQPSRGLLLFFPSYVKHAMDRNNSPNKRYSLAFNIIPAGSYGSGDSFYNPCWD